MAKTTLIKATSRVSVKINDSFYTFEWCEERVLEPEDNIEEERAKLWDTCHGEVDTQVEDVVNLLKK